MMRLQNFRRLTKRGYASSVDQKEIEHFNKLLAHWWDPNGICKMLHLINDYRVDVFKENLIKFSKIPEEVGTSAQPLTDLSILDVGCGGGLLTESLAKLGSQTVGLDPSADLISLARSHAHDAFPHLRYVQSTIEEFAETNEGRFDAVVASETIEHIDEKRQFLRACVKCLKPGGSILVTTNNRTWSAFFVDIFLTEHVFGLIPKGTHQYGKFIHLDALKAMLGEESCETVFSEGSLYNPFKDKWVRSSIKQFWYFLHAVKENK